MTWLTASTDYGIVRRPEGWELVVRRDGHERALATYSREVDASRDLEAMKMGGRGR